MVITVNLLELIPLIIIVGLFVLWVLCIVISSFLNLFKKDCYKCKHYDLYDVASAGDLCWYKCDLKNERDIGTSMNTRCRYVRCKNFEKKEDTE